MQFFDFFIYAHRFSYMKIAYVCSATAILFLSLFSIAADMDDDGIDDEDEIMLAQKYAPIFYFEEDEEVFPVNVEYFILNSNLNISEEDGTRLIDAHPSPEELGNYTDVEKNYYLDNRKGTIYDNGIVEDYKKNEASLGYTVYFHVFKNEGKTFIQYWLFYVFNKGVLNTHEGDWEMAQIILDENNKPYKAVYSQHVGGQAAAWKYVEKEGNHPKVYVARGSHANYFRYYQGLMGFARDIVGKDGKILKPEEYNLISLGEKGRGNWLDFAGRWGDFGKEEEDELKGRRGPHGPAYRNDGNMWNGKFDSYLLPLNKELLAFEWFLYNFTLIYAILFIMSVSIAIFGVYRRHKKYGIKKPYSSLLNIKGINAKSIASVLAILSIIISFLSLFYPWYGVFAEVKGENEIEYTKIISIDGMHGLQVNMLEPDSGTVQIGALPIPFSLLIAASIFIFILEFAS